MNNRINWPLNRYTAEMLRHGIHTFGLVTKPHQVKPRLRWNPHSESWWVRYPTLICRDFTEYTNFKLLKCGGPYGQGGVSMKSTIL